MCKNTTKWSKILKGDKLAYVVQLHCLLYWLMSSTADVRVATCQNSEKLLRNMIFFSGSTVLRPVLHVSAYTRVYIFYHRYTGPTAGCEWLVETLRRINNCWFAIVSQEWPCKTRYYFVRSSNRIHHGHEAWSRSETHTHRTRYDVHSKL